MRTIDLLSAEGEGVANWSHQALKARHRQRNTRGTMEICRGVHGIKFDEVRTLQQERISSYFSESDHRVSPT